MFVCPDKGQGKDREESEMIGLEIFIKVVPSFSCRIDDLEFHVELELSVYLHVAVGVYSSTLLDMHNFLSLAFQMVC